MAEPDIIELSKTEAYEALKAAAITGMTHERAAKALVFQDDASPNFRTLVQKMASVYAGHEVEIADVSFGGRTKKGITEPRIVAECGKYIVGQGKRR